METISPEEKPVRERDHMLAGSIVVAALLVSGSILYLVGALQKGGDLKRGNDSDGTPSAPSGALSLSERDVLLGDPNAKVTIIEYGDYQCPFCARFFTQTEPVLRSNYIETGKANMVFRNFQFLGPESVAAAEAAECAKDEGKFWAFHDALYREESKDGREHNGNLNRELFLRIARELGLNEGVFSNCVDERNYAGLIEEDYNAAQLLGVNSTPTSFVNDSKIVGAQPFSVFQAAIEEAIQKAL